MESVWTRIYDEAHNSRDYRGMAPDGKELGVVQNKDGSPSVASWGGVRNPAKAFLILADGSAQNIHEQLGFNHKVRNFYNSILDPRNAEHQDFTVDTRSEERRVGKECRSRW